MGIFPKFNKSIRCFQHRHASLCVGQTDRGVNQLVFIEVACLNHLKTKSILVKGYGGIQIFDADRDVVNANNHVATCSSLGSLG